MSITCLSSLWWSLKYRNKFRTLYTIKIDKNLYASQSQVLPMKLFTPQRSQTKIRYYSHQLLQIVNIDKIVFKFVFWNELVQCANLLYLYASRCFHKALLQISFFYSFISVFLKVLIPHENLIILNTCPEFGLSQSLEMYKIPSIVGFSHHQARIEYS